MEHNSDKTAVYVLKKHLSKFTYEKYGFNLKVCITGVKYPNEGKAILLHWIKTGEWDPYYAIKNFVNHEETTIRNNIFYAIYNWDEINEPESKSFRNSPRDSDGIIYYIDLSYSDSLDHTRGSLWEIISSEHCRNLPFLVMVDVNAFKRDIIDILHKVQVNLNELKDLNIKTSDPVRVRNLANAIFTEDATSVSFHVEEIKNQLTFNYAFPEHIQVVFINLRTGEGIQDGLGWLREKLKPVAEDRMKKWFEPWKLVEHGRNLMQSEPRQAMEDFTTAYRVFDILENTEGKFHAMYALTELVLDTQNADQAKRRIKALRALATQLEDLMLAENVLSLEGLIAYEDQLYEHAISKFEQALEKATHTNIHTAVVNAYCNLGECYLCVGNLNEAMDYFDKARLLSMQKNDKKGLAMAQIYLAKTLSQLIKRGDFSGDVQARYYLNETIQVLEQLEFYYGLIQAYSAYGDLESMVGNIEAASLYYDKAAELALQNQNQKLYEYFNNKQGEEAPFPYIFYYPYPKGSPMENSERIPLRKTILSDDEKEK